MNTQDDLVILKGTFLKSQWPKCNLIAEQLLQIGTEEAKSILLEGLKGKHHHLRTAAIRALTSFHDASIIMHLVPLLNDPAYETRVQAKKSIEELSGEAKLD